MNIYVGNLEYGVTEEKLKSVFEEVGTVETVKIIRDKMTGRSKGFGFVEMPNDDEAREAITALNGKELGKRAMAISEARPREEGNDRNRS